MPPIAYRVRRALAGFTLLLLLVLASGPSDAACDLVQIARVPLELKNYLFVVPVTLNGHAIGMLLDTGAQKSMLGEAAVQRLNLVRDPRSLTSLMGLSGTSAQPDARIDSMSELENDRMIKLHVIAGDDTPSHVHWFDSLQIGPAVSRHPYAYVLAKEPHPLGADRNFGDGVIGVDFLGGQRVWISAGTGRLYLARNGGG